MTGVQTCALPIWNGHFENIGETGITADGNVIIKAEKGDVINKDGGNIEAEKGVSITAKNLYNTERYITDGKDSVILAGGGRIKGSDVYIDVKGKVVNGTEGYEKGTNRRKDGVLVDNRNVTALNPSIIGGINSTAIKGGNLVNKIGRASCRERV